VKNLQVPKLNKTLDKLIEVSPRLSSSPEWSSPPLHPVPCPVERSSSIFTNHLLIRPIARLSANQVSSHGLLGMVLLGIDPVFHEVTRTNVLLLGYLQFQGRSKRRSAPPPLMG